MWKWLEKVVGTYEKPLVLTKEVKRARTKRGRYKGDKKSTKNYNEAWVGGKAVSYTHLTLPTNREV